MRSPKRAKRERNDAMWSTSIWKSEKEVQAKITEKRHVKRQEEEQENQ